ncbi:unnamed protein product [Meganyctiphanes norvegica]|uniref:Protein kinase domain-containing protein n=1 Tax=Meganyctiphanes norvegica TaxID=48144 RepID=A0AAV2PLK7_MEGNR
MSNYCCLKFNKKSKSTLEEEDEEEEEVEKEVRRLEDLGKVEATATREVAMQEDNTQNTAEPVEEEEESSEEEEDFMRPIEDGDTAPTVRWHSGFQRKYVVVHDLGKGRFSMVKRCRRLRDNFEVAAKFVGRQRQSDDLTEREFHLLRRLQHPAFPRAVALYKATPKFSIMLTELVMGIPLLDWFFAQEEPTESKCAYFITQLVAALQYLHSKNIAHLDVKPENILVDISKGSNIPVDEKDLENGATEDSIPFLRLVDLNSAHELQCERDSEGREGWRVPPGQGPPLLGSAEFMAPELLKSEGIGAEADLWSLGVLIYILVSGHSPFLGTSPAATCKNILSGEVRYPVEHFATATQESCDLIQDLLMLDPKDRSNLDTVLQHQWFNMTECESLLPVQGLADFAFRRTKMASSTLEVPVLHSNNIPKSMPE